MFISYNAVYYIWKINNKVIYYFYLGNHLKNFNQLEKLQL